MSYQPYMARNFFEDRYHQKQAEIAKEEEDAQNSEEKEDDEATPPDTVEQILERSRKLRRKYSKLTERYR